MKTAELNDYDVYVTPAAILEVCRGEHMTTTQFFTETENTPPNVFLGAIEVMPPARCAAEEAPLQPIPRGNTLWLGITLIASAVVLGLLLARLIFR